MKAADVVHGENLLIVSRPTGKISGWSFDENWDYVSRKTYKRGSPAIRKLEKTLDIDLDGNTHVGIPDSFFETIEDLGSVQLEKDNIADAYWVTISNGIRKSIIYRRRELTTKRLLGWVPAHADVVNGENKVLLTKGSNLFVEWSLDKDWSYQSRKRFMTGSAEFFDAETKFNYDLDEDGNIGLQYKLVESKGDVHLKLDSLNQAWVEYPDGSLKPVLSSGKQIRERKALSLLSAAESFDDSINKLILTSNTGNLYEWTLDADWNRLSSQKIRSNSDRFYELEGMFEMDFNGDSITGRNLEIIDNLGNEKLLLDQYSGYGWVQHSDGSLDDITNRGRRIRVQDRGWIMRVAEKIDDENKLVFSNIDDGDVNDGNIVEWTLDSAWDLVGSINHDYQSDSYHELEEVMKVDFDGNGIVGA